MPDIFKGLYPVIDKPEYAITLIDWQKENSLDLFAQIHAGIRYFEQDGVPPTPWTRSANAKGPSCASYLFLLMGQRLVQ